MIVHGGELLVSAHLNFGKFILDRLRKANPDDTCWYNCTTGDKLTYGKFTQHAVNVGAALTELGVARGDTVAVAGEPRATFMPTALAVIFTGAAYTPLELDCGRAILAHKLNLTRPKYVICSRLFWEAYADILKGLDCIKTFICFDDIDDIQLSIETMASRHADVTQFEPASVQGATDVAMVVYSSGTTGMSKGVLLTHLNCIARANLTCVDHSLHTSWAARYCVHLWRNNTLSLGCVLNTRYCDAEFLHTCFFYGELSSIYTISMIFYFLSVGKRFIYSECGLNLKTLQDNQVDTIPSGPAGVQAMVNAENVEQYDLSSLKIMYSVGDHLHHTIIKSFQKRFPQIKLLQLYGASEIDKITVQFPSNIKTTTTVGIAAPGVTIKVVDVNTRAILGPNQRGEICVRSPTMMKGYLGATSPYLDEQGFYLTGDLGYYDDEKHFFLVDRIKNIISFDGYKLSPREVEAVLLRHPAVREAAVVGKPAGALGELPTAFVVLHPGAQATDSELIDYVAKEVSGYMQLRGGVRFVSELPRSARQKVLHRQLREMLDLEGHLNN